MIYHDTTLPDGEFIPATLQAEFRTIGTYANTYGCCRQHDETMFFDYESIREEFLQRCNLLLGGWHALEIEKSIARFEAVAFEHVQGSGLCRYHTDVLPQLDPHFEESGLNSDLLKTLQ